MSDLLRTLFLNAVLRRNIEFVLWVYAEIDQPFPSMHLWDCNSPGLSCQGISMLVWSRGSECEALHTDGCPLSVQTWAHSHRHTGIPCWYWALCIDIFLSPSPYSTFYNGWQWWWAAMQISLQIPRPVLWPVHNRRQDRWISMVWDHWRLRQRQEIWILSRDWYEECCLHNTV